MYKNLAATLVAACFFSPVFSQTTPAKGSTAEPVKAGFVYVSPITEAGWTRQHEEGRKAVEAALGNQVTLWTGSVFGTERATRAWPASW